MDLVTCLLDFRLNFASNRSIVPRLAASLAACAQLSALGTQKPLRTRDVVLTVLSSKSTTNQLSYGSVQTSPPQHKIIAQILSLFFLMCTALTHFCVLCF